MRDLLWLFVLLTILFAYLYFSKEPVQIINSGNPELQAKLNQIQIEVAAKQKVIDSLSNVAAKEKTIIKTIYAEAADEKKYINRINSLDSLIWLYSRYKSTIEQSRFYKRTDPG